MYYTLNIHHTNDVTDTEEYDGYTESIERAHTLRAEEPLASFTIIETDSGKIVYTLRAPEVGMDATYSINGDSYGYEVVSVSKSGKRVGLNRKGAIRPSIHVGLGPDMFATLRQNGSYRPMGQSYAYVTFGDAVEKRDPHF